MEALLSDINNFLSKCNNCGLCKKACPFLEKYGLPAEIIRNSSESVYLCTNCGACNNLCPKFLKPANALHIQKYILIKKGSLAPTTKKAISSSLNFAFKGHSFPFMYYPKAEVGFWPGCSLAGSNPALVRRIKEILKQHYKNVNIVLDCCFDPAFQNGDIDAVTNSASRIRERLKESGIKKLILGCGNCKKIFSLFMPEIETQHVLQLLDFDRNGLKDFSGKKVYLHHPCPSFRFEELQTELRSKLSKVVSLASTSEQPMCCGLGGLCNSMDEPLSFDFTKRVTNASGDNVILTYCMGCKNRFIKNGSKSYHILELLSGVKPFEKAVPSTKKWINRLTLSLSLRLKQSKILLGFFLILAIVISFYLQRKGILLPEKIVSYIKQHPVLAPLIFIIVYSVGPSIFLPSLPLTIAAGVIWGPFWGVVFSIIGATIGATVAFLLSRYLMAETVKKKFGYEKWQWLKEKVEQHGWKAVAFARLLPILPFPVLNYLFGITPIPLLQYLGSTFIFMLPACIAFVVFGHSMGELISSGNIKPVLVAIVLVSVLMLLPVFFKSLYRKIFPEKDA